MVYYHEILPWVNMVLGKTIIPKLNLLPVSLAPSLHSWIWALCTALVEHPVLSCHYLLPHSFHSLLTGLMAFILELLNTHGNQSNITKSQYSSMALMIKIKTSLHISQGLYEHPSLHQDLWSYLLPFSPLFTMLNPHWLLAVLWTVMVYSCLKTFTLAVPSFWNVLLDSSMAAHPLPWIPFRFLSKFQFFREPFTG